ncbi:MAG: hypothetical protein A3K04_08160 [Gallionellales bacterium RBG_16_56_9]|nr:MAG: hypothetical protein A3K04_08160 [Gallionellales bacterium RBG_16_56_9]
MALRVSIMTTLQTLLQGISPAFTKVAVMRALPWDQTELPAANIKEAEEGEEIADIVSCNKVRPVLHVQIEITYATDTPYADAANKIYAVMEKIRADETGARTLAVYSVNEITEVNSKVVIDHEEQKVSTGILMLDLYYERNRLSGT